jgi:tight adherence protein B
VTRALLIVIGAIVALLLVGVAVTQVDENGWLVAGLLLVTAGGVAAATFGALRQQRRSRFRGRMRRFVNVPGDELPATSGKITRDDATRADRSASQAVLDLIAPESELAGIEASLAHIVLGMIAIGLAIGVGAALLISSPWGLLAGLVAPLATRTVIKRRVARTRKRFEQQLPDNLDVVSSALRVGQSLVGAFTVTVEAADEPSRSELGRAIADEQLGVPFDVALRRVAVRMQSRDVDQVALVARLQRQAGTNAAEVIDQVSANIRGRMDLERLVRTLTAQGRMARWIVSLLPVFLFGAMYVLNKEYLAPLWQTTEGKLGLVVAAIMICTGSFVIKKIVEIEV